MLNQNSRMNCLVVDALLGMLLNHMEKVVRSQIFNDAVDALQRLINGYGADRRRGGVDDGGANLVQVSSPCGEVHDSIRPIFDRSPELLKLFLNI